MARVDYEFGRFKQNRSGIAETWKSIDMQAALAEVVEEKVREANEMGHVGNLNATLYWGGVDVADKTAIGHVTTQGKLGYIDQKSHNTLDAINHW